MAIPGIQFNQEEIVKEFEQRKAKAEKLEVILEQITNTKNFTRNIIQNPWQNDYFNKKRDQRVEIENTINALVNTLKKQEDDSKYYYTHLSISGNTKLFRSNPANFEIFMNDLLECEEEIKKKISELNKGIGEK